MTLHWLSTRRMTFGVATDALGIVRRAAPIARRFIGQSIDNLRRWLRKQGGFRERTCNRKAKR